MSKTGSESSVKNYLVVKFTEQSQNASPKVI